MPMQQRPVNRGKDERRRRPIYIIFAASLDAPGSARPAMVVSSAKRIRRKSLLDHAPKSIAANGLRPRQSLSSVGLEIVHCRARLVFGVSFGRCIPLNHSQPLRDELNRLKSLVTSGWRREQRAGDSFFIDYSISISPPSLRVITMAADPGRLDPPSGQ